MLKNHQIENMLNTNLIDDTIPRKSSHGFYEISIRETHLRGLIACHKVTPVRSAASSASNPLATSFHI